MKGLLSFSTFTGCLMTLIFTTEPVMCTPLVQSSFEASKTPKSIRLKESIRNHKRSFEKPLPSKLRKSRSGTEDLVARNSTPLQGEVDQEGSLSKGSPSQVFNDKVAEGEDEHTINNLPSHPGHEDRKACPKPERPEDIEEASEKTHTGTIGIQDDSRDMSTTELLKRPGLIVEGASPPLPTSTNYDVASDSDRSENRDEVQRRYQQSLLEYLEDALQHEYIDRRASSPGQKFDSGISRLLSMIDIREVEENSPRSEPRAITSSDVSISRLQRLGRHRWYKNQKLLNSWKKAGVGPMEKQLMIIVGEALQVWSNDFSKTIKHWYPEFLTLWDDFAVMAPLGTTDLTRSLALKNSKMLFRATSLTSARNLNLAYRWYKSLMGAQEWTRRWSLLIESGNQSETAIMNKAISYLNTSPVHKSYPLYFLMMKKELDEFYPELIECSSMVVANNDYPQRCLARESKISADLQEYTTGEFLKRAIKSDEKWPMWSAKEVANILSWPIPLPSPTLEEVRKHPWNKARIAQISGGASKLVDLLVSLMKSCAKRISVASFLNLRWLAETLFELSPKIRDDIHKETQFLLSLDASTYAERLYEASQSAEMMMTWDLEKIFLEPSVFSSSKALIWLFKIERMRTCPTFWGQASNRMRSEMHDRQTNLDFDQKYEWVQVRSQSAMSALLVTSYRSLIDLVESDSFHSSVALDLHLLNQSLKSLYNSNILILNRIRKHLIRHLGVEVVEKADRAIGAALRQNWTRSTWEKFTEGELGYHKGDGIFEHIEALGTLLKFKDDYPTFLEVDLQSHYKKFLQIPDDIKNTIKGILEEEYHERADLLTILTIQDQAQKTEVYHDTVPWKRVSQKLSNWLRRGISASSMILLSRALGLGISDYVVHESMGSIDIERFEGRLRSFLDSNPDEECLDYQELSDLFESFHHSAGELLRRVLAVKDYLATLSGSSSQYEKQINLSEL